MTPELHDAVGALMVALVGLFTILFERIAERVKSSPAVQRATLREAAADDCQEQVRLAIERTDAAWQVRWDKRQAEVDVLVANFNALIATSNHNADLHEKALDRFDAELDAAHNQSAGQREDAAGLRTKIEHLEAEVARGKENLDRLTKQYEDDRKMWRRTLKESREALDEMRRRGQEKGVVFTATDFKAPDSEF